MVYCDTKYLGNTKQSNRAFIFVIHLGHSDVFNKGHSTLLKMKCVRKSVEGFFS